MIERKFLAILLAFVLIGAGFVQADTQTEKLMNKVLAKSKNINSYTTDLSMTMKVMEKEMVSTGKLSYKKPGKSHMKMNTQIGNMNMEQTVVSDGKTTWTYQPQMNMAQKIDIGRIVEETGIDITEQHGGELSNALGGLEKDSISYVKTDTINGEEVYIFEGKPKDSDMGNMPFTLSKMQLWLSPKDGMPRKVIIFDEGNKQIMSQEYSNMKVNIDIPDSRFEFTPPEGVQIMDMTESTLDMMKQTQGEGQAPRIQ